MSIYSLLSAFLSLLLLTSTVVINARSARLGLFPETSIEVRSLALLTLILLIALNGNQFMSGSILFPLLATAAIVSILTSIRKLSGCERLEALREGAPIFALQSAALLAVFAIFQMDRYWLLEGANHDSIVYYQGLHWAMEAPLFVGKEAVRALWGLGVCLEGASWVGYDCPLYRGGTYTVAAWAQYFSPHLNGNALWFVAAYGATIAWFGARLLPGVAVGRCSRWRPAVPALAVTFSTGLIGALVNSNLATVLGAASLVPIIGLAMRGDLPARLRYGLMSAWCAVAAHVYAESVFYAGLLTALIVLLELPRHIRELQLRGVISLLGLMVLIVFGFGNVAVGQAVSSLLFFGDIGKSGEWFSWYLSQPLFFWTGSFIAGLLIGGEKPFVTIVIVAAAITLAAAFVLVCSRQTRSAALALIGLSVCAVLYIELTAYQYGEHKIVHLLGPAWSLMVAFAAVRLLGVAGYFAPGRVATTIQRASGAVLLLGIGLISTAFVGSVNFFLNHHLRGPHGMDFGVATIASYVRPGDSVLVDDTAWLGVEKFHKAHYVIFHVHHQRASALLPNLSSDPLRGGYFREVRKDTFTRTEGVDWLVQSRGYGLPSSKFIPPDTVPIWENADYRLYRAAGKTVAVAGNGWHECEPSHCWTVSPFEIEVYVPQGEKFQVSIDFAVFDPPEGGTITVRDAGGRVLGTTHSLSEQMHINLPSGWSRLVFDSDWPITSPLETGVSADGRKLFAAIRRVELVRTEPPMDK